MKKAVMFVVGLSVFSFCSIIALGEDTAPDQTPTADTSNRQEVITAENGKYKITIDTSQTPELTRRRMKTGASGAGMVSQNRKNASKPRI